MSMSPKKIMAVPSADRQQFVLRIGTWRGTYPIEYLPDQIKLYRGLMERNEGAYAAFYAPTVEKLESLQRRIAEKG